MSGRKGLSAGMDLQRRAQTNAARPHWLDDQQPDDPGPRLPYLDHAAARMSFRVKLALALAGAYLAGWTSALLWRAFL